MTDPRIIEERTADDWVLHTTVPDVPGRETVSPAQRLRDSGLAHYGVGVTVQRIGFAFHVFGGEQGRKVCECSTLDAADFVARALVGLSFVVLETKPPGRCPKCEHEKAQVIDTRPSAIDIRRRRRCLKCNARWSTSERIVVPTTKRGR